MYSITLKAANCKTCLDLTNGNITEIDEWINKNLRSRNWIGELFYNDEPPNSRCFSNGGHSKGIIVWNETEIGWLIHSVPKWPSTFIDPVPNPECEYGQSFAWIILPIEKLPMIISQIQLMHAHVYHDPQNRFIPLKHTPEILVNFLKLTDNISHIGKHQKWNDDIFENGLATEFPNSTWKSETWSRPEQSGTAHVNRVHKIYWDKFTYNDKQDHSKWAISDNDTSIVCIGDMNAMLSQFKRGGGFILFKDKDLWHNLHSIIVIELKY